MVPSAKRALNLWAKAKRRAIRGTRPDGRVDDTLFGGFCRVLGERAVVGTVHISTLGVIMASLLYTGGTIGLQSNGQLICPAVIFQPVHKHTEQAGPLGRRQGWPTFRKESTQTRIRLVLELRQHSFFQCR